jgi:nucleotide-binding universal stress UspA family protein
MTLHGTVLVGSDLTPGAEEALRQADALAAGLKCALVVCHVLPELLRVRMLFPQWGGIDPAFQEAITGKARDALDRQLASIVGDENVEVQLVLDSGTPHAGLLAQADAAGAGVIVVGPGKVADFVVRHASVPVLVARPSPAGVVIGATDFSDPSLPALDTAASEAGRRGAALKLLHAVDVGTQWLANSAIAGMPHLGGAPTAVLDVLEDLRAAAELRLQESLRHFNAKGEVLALSGPAAGVIVTTAQDARAELVVVGTQGRTGLARLTLGSTAEAVLHSAPCSVLVVRLATARASELPRHQESARKRLAMNRRGRLSS